ncbi:glutamate-rich WD repeat-containing protein 1-like isoform X2 [Acanthaster planci]|uniref:Glutamate-rich WD repeat-containing protein 1 n=1 Tax=Acanthaster planci TaxID=133434 RepID=A0A8B7ZXW1_ACAPL|nr:glutamate-rich WD repeat-containing protein 1-like isoform X2 [Acanthaster planci]
MCRIPDVSLVVFNNKTQSSSWASDYSNILQCSTNNMASNSGGMNPEHAEAESENTSHSTSEVEEEMEVVDPENSDMEESDGEGGERRVYLPGDPLDEGEMLVRDDSAYHMYHQAQTGTQAEKAHLNNVIIMKMTNLHRTSQKDDDDDSDEDSDSDDEDSKPELETAMLKHLGSVNRIRSTDIGQKQVAATWADTGTVHLWDLTSALQAVNNAHLMGRFMRQESHKPLFSFTGHQIEGYAIDWCPTASGNLITGDCRRNIHLWKLQEGGEWSVDQRPYAAHAESVEDLQWSPNEKNVFASCSVDKSIRIWDVRATPSKACMITMKEAHSSDVNVIHWNRKDPFILSGGDDGVLNVWDLRQFQKKAPPVAKFKHHTGPITSVEWNPQDSTVFAAAGSDDQLTLWDLSLERERETAPEGESGQSRLDGIPPQLLFVHQGQSDIKELHWHPQIPGVLISTAHSGFNIFKTISV